MSDLSNYGENSESSGTSKSVYTLPVPPVNQAGVKAAYDYLTQIGEIEQGSDCATWQSEDLQDLVYRLTVELARTRSLLRLERLFTDDTLDELQELQDQVDQFTTEAGIDWDMISELQQRCDTAEDMADAMASSIDWNALLVSDD